MDRTIAAISTPSGAGGIAVIRISGKNAVEIADKVFWGKNPLKNAQSHTVHYGFIKDTNGRKIDEVLLTVMLAPRTFTKEDVVEISTHGGMSASREVLGAVISAGADIAEPGEFTKRAFLNGRIDLSQAEAVIDIINSTNTLAKSNALSQLEGKLGKEIKSIRSTLVHLSAQMQVIIDYPDEDLEDVTVDDIEAVCTKCLFDTNALLKTADSGKIIRDGLRTAIAGKPNVGKSSLLNALSRADRAIVTDIAGTTRDVIEEYINLDGIPIILADTAGIHETDDTVEKIGVEKSKEAIEGSDLVIVIIDGSRPLDDDDIAVLKDTEDKNRVILVNKTDLSKMADNIDLYTKKSDEVIEISALTGDGIDKLSEYIKNMYNLSEANISSGAVITNIRHKKALESASDALKNAVNSLQAGMPSDIASIDINSAIDSLGEITGETVSDLIVESIFHNFCVGK